MPAVSVVIPTYERRELVLEAVASVFAQTFRDYEILVIDDGSTDGTEEALQPMAQRVRYFRKANGGVASARNFGIREAQGSLIAFLDSDDLWEPPFLEVTTRYLEENTEIALVSTGWRTLPSGHRWPPVRAPLLCGDLFPELFRNRLVRTSTVVARTPALLETGLFNGEHEPAEDLDMWLKIAARYPTAFLNRHLSWGRRHDTRLSKDRRLHLERQLQVLAAHYDPRRISRQSFTRRRARLYTELGETHVKLGDFAAAQTCFRRALALAPFSLRARRYLLTTSIATRRRPRS